jgi:hypothetical protein
MAAVTAARTTADEEFEQHEPRRLNTDDEAFEDDDQRVAQNQDDRHPDKRCRRLGDADDGQRKTRVREGECADADEGQGVDEYLQHRLEELG